MGTPGRAPAEKDLTACATWARAAGLACPPTPHPFLHRLCLDTPPASLARPPSPLPLPHPFITPLTTARAPLRWRMRESVRTPPPRWEGSTTRTPAEKDLTACAR